MASVVAFAAATASRREQGDTLIRSQLLAVPPPTGSSVVVTAEVVPARTGGDANTRPPMSNPTTMSTAPTVSRRRCLPIPAPPVFVPTVLVALPRTTAPPMIAHGERRT